MYVFHKEGNNSMDNGWKIVRILILVLYCQSTSANTVLVVASENFSESYAENVKVSGSVLVASYITGSFSKASPDQLHLYVPNHVPEINLIISSIDGKYTADVLLSLKKSQTGWLQLKLPTAYKKEYAKYLPNELVALAFTDSEDIFGNYVQEVFPTSWGKPLNSHLKFYMNSAGGNPNITFKEQSGDVVVLDCKEIDAEFTRVFNHVCELGEYAIIKSSIITFSPEYESSGKNYIIWPANE
mgnify:FL=1|tara:strand:+ start:7618 stop:8343 length:726 start_codon:yes stop_codon:yes gene_type:complete